MKILIVADTDLDGTGSAVIITKYYEMFFKSGFFFKKPPQVDVLFPAREELNELFGDKDWCTDVLARYNHIYLCDTAPNSPEACDNIGIILAPKMTIFDHHATNLKRLEPYKGNFMFPNSEFSSGFFIIEGDRCSAKIAFETLQDSLGMFSERGQKFDSLSQFANLVNDLDLWYRKFPRSTELADYVAMVGAKAAYSTLLKIATNPDVNTDDMVPFLNKVKKQKERSLSLARATLVKHKGYKTPFYTCLVDDWASWVAGEVKPKTGMLAMFDLARKTLSFRVGDKYVGNEWHQANEPKPDCLDFVEPLGGGGHPQAAGVNTGEASPIFKQLSERLGEILLEKYNERSRNTTERRVRRTNSGSRKPRAERSGIRSRSTSTK